MLCIFSFQPTTRVETLCHQESFSALFTSPVSSILLISHLLNREVLLSRNLRKNLCVIGIISRNFLLYVKVITTAAPYKACFKLPIIIQKQLFNAAAQRQIGETFLNEASSRSHQILRLVCFLLKYVQYVGPKRIYMHMEIRQLQHLAKMLMNLANRWLTCCSRLVNSHWLLKPTQGGGTETFILFSLTNFLEFCRQLKVQLGNLWTRVQALQRLLWWDLRILSFELYT